MPRTQSNRTTLTQVARSAGVSTATASMVLSGKGEGARIAAATAERVRAVADRLDYSPNLLVHSIQRGSSGVLAFFSTFRNLDDDDVYMDRLTRGLEQAAGRRGHDLLLQCAFNRTTEESYRSINGGRADGLLLFAPHPEDPMLPLMRRSRFPCVLLNARDPEGVLPSATDDVAGGIQALALALREQGHRRVACVHAGPHDTPDAATRIAHLERSLPEATIDEWLMPPSGDLDQELQKRLGGTVPPTALFCATDRIAYWVVASLGRLGLRVPSDISVVGYDGIRWAGDSPQVVESVSVDLRSLASAAVDLLLDGPGAASEIVIPTRPFRGTTLGPAPTLQRSKS